MTTKSLFPYFLTTSGMLILLIPISLGYGIFNSLVACVRLRNSVEVVAYVTELEVRSIGSRSGSSMDIDVRYYYFWGNQRYTSTRTSLWFPMGFELSRLNFSKSTGCGTRCYVSPENPELCVLDKRFHFSSFILVLAFFVASFVFGMLTFVSGLRKVGASFKNVDL